MDSFPEDSGRIAAVDPAVLAAIPSPPVGANTCPFAALCPWQTWNRPPERAAHPLAAPHTDPEPEDSLDLPSLEPTPAVTGDPEEEPSWRSSATRRKVPPTRPRLRSLPDGELDRARTLDRVDGGTLRRLRQLRGVSLETICDRTKISMMILRFIEEDRHEDLPAPIYLRGYLEQVRSLLGLPGFVIDRYLDGLPDESDQDGSTVRIRRA